MTGIRDLSWQAGNGSGQYDTFARNTFARIYPVIADQVLERTGITKGACLDVGSGPGLLAITLALLSDLRVTALDSSPEMYGLSQKNIRDRCMEDLIVPVIGDVHAIPAADATFRLVVSRGSFHSWEDLPTAFREIRRVLQPGGMAYIGGGYGSARLREDVYADCRGCGIVDNAGHPVRSQIIRLSAGEIESTLESAGISDYRIINDDSGIWIIFRKSEK